MAWCLFAISTNPEVEDRVLAELDTLGLLAKAGYPEPRSLEVSDLGKLPYLNAAIKEAMRLHTVRMAMLLPFHQQNGWMYHHPFMCVVYLSLQHAEKHNLCASTYC
jgi:hypothetical protein